ncbi:uncharacterized protein NEMAJ01_2235 [Nematocida major]|uniref:uncharacterized protein n=1 Tax=Nematocida major TaxID=1912982 RepID=UPI002008A711|nr:uncharacterized protein NEMAJ01_2235 [Nematocida major]KAH9387339.1 hypothetical protein NEMAJ01_2235 [Nematocida major]
MKVYECTVNGERGIIGVDRKYLKICTRHEILGMEDISEISQDKADLAVLLHSKRTLNVHGLDDACAATLLETGKSKRMISKEEISDSIKRNIQLQKSYRSISPAEHRVFYRIFGESLLKGARPNEPLKIEQASSSGKAKFLISNRTAMQAYFNMDIPFGVFVKCFYSGYLTTGSPENDVDLEIFRILKRPINPMERVNVQSMVQQDIAETPAEPIKKKPAPAKKEHLINPCLVNPLVSRESDKSSECSRGKLGRPILFPPKIRISSIHPIRRVGIPVEILRRMKEISKLVFKNKASSEDLEEISNNMQQSLKEEIRRKLPIEEADAVILAISRISPSRFLNALKANHRK